MKDSCDPEWYFISISISLLPNKPPYVTKTSPIGPFATVNVTYRTYEAHNTGFSLPSPLS